MTGCTSNKSKEEKEELVNHNQVYNCEISTNNFHIIKTQARQNKIVMDDWLVEYNADNKSLSYQKSNEEIFVIFAREYDLDFIPLGKIGFTNSTEEQKELFCQTLDLIESE